MIGGDTLDFNLIVCFELHCINTISDDYNIIYIHTCIYIASELRFLRIFAP